MAPRKKVAPSQPAIPNPEQETVIKADTGFFKVLAGPGSGKSFCLVNRYVRLVQSGVSPQDLLSLTFTNSAAKQMRDRAEAIIPVQKTDRVSGWMTFHSLALQFCTLERDHFPFKLAESVLALEPVAAKIASDIARKYEMDYRNLRPYISLQKRNRVRPKDALALAEKSGTGEKQALAYKMYQSRLLEAGILDFDSLILEMSSLLETNLEVRKRWSYRFIQSDESQDNSPLEWNILRSISATNGNLLAVGDCGQGVYGFRGAEGQLFMDMDRIFGNVKTLYLAKNHRSTPQITALCKQIGPVKELAEKFYSTNLDGPDPVIKGFASSHHEAEFIVKEIKSSLCL